MTEHTLEGARSDQIVVGRINGVFGIRGQLKVLSYTDPRENIFNYNPWLLGSGEACQAVTVISGQKHGKGIIASFEGCEERGQALAWVGKRVSIFRDQLPATKENEFYWSDLVGLIAVTTDGVTLGQVSRLLETGSNDVLVVEGERQRLIPYIWDQVIKCVNLEQGQITVDWDLEF